LIYQFRIGARGFQVESIDRRQHEKKPQVYKQVDGKAMKGLLKLEEYFYYVSSTCQASDFENTTEFVIDHIKKN